MCVSAETFGSSQRLKSPSSCPRFSRETCVSCAPTIPRDFSSRNRNKPVRLGVYSLANSPPRVLSQMPESSAFDQVSDNVIKEPLFMAMFLTIKAGAVVTWTNTGDEPYIVRSDFGPTRSAVDTEETITFAFDKPGTYHCACSIHPRMIVTVVVE
jgi:plastocyanin